MWIESHQDLEEHPKLLDLCNKTGWSLDEAIGRLHRLWWWTLKYAEDGDLNKYDPSQFLVRLSNKLSPQKLYEILQETNFIDKKGLIHDWFDYAGRYLTTKYRTSNPNRLLMIEKKYKSVKSQTKDRLKSDNQPTIPTIPTIPNPQQFFYLKYKEVFKKDYIASFGKDGKIFKDILAIVPNEECFLLINKFFISEDKFIKESGYTIGVFKSQINKLRQPIIKAPEGAAGRPF